MSVPVVSASGLLSLWTALLLPWPADSCMQSAWSSGRLGAEERVQAMTLTSPSAGSCTCCALCHSQQGCASLSYNDETAECELYNTVASFTTMQPDWEEQWKYFTMPGRSERGQFCRQDSDCLAEGDACRGRVCTNRTSVTCRDIAETFGDGDTFGTMDVFMFGWLSNRETALECDTFGELTGFTELLSIRSGANLGNMTFLELNRQLDLTVGAHSILGLTDVIRQLREEPTYHIFVSADGEHVLTEEQSRVRRDETLTIENLETSISISFRNEQGILIRVLIPSGSAVREMNDTRSDGMLEYIGMLEYVGMLELDGLRHAMAVNWIEIYMRE